MQVSFPFCSTKQKHWRMVRASLLLVNNNAISIAIFAHRKELCDEIAFFTAKTKITLLLYGVGDSLGRFLRVWWPGEGGEGP